MMKQVKFKLPLRICAILMGMFLTVNAFAQQITVNGQVKDATGEPIIGATIRVAGQSGGVISDFDGNFVIKANQGETIQISYVGYLPTEVAAAPNLVITLQDDAQTLGDVVVIGYGTMKKSDLTGSVVQVKAEELNKGAITSAQEMLQGKVSGLFVQPSSGAPGGGSTLRIRGGASLNASNNPLIVIDGVPVSDDAAPGMNNALSSINPSDIESFSVLKDASATAIFGSRASNGVIIITTKKGSKGLKISYSSTYSVQDPYKKLDVLSAKQLVAGMMKSYEGTAAGENLRGIFEQYGTITQDADGNYIYDGVETDWQDLIYHTAFQTDQNVSVNGQIGVVPFRVSLGYNNEDGTVKESNFERYTGALALNPKLFNDHLNITLNAKGTIANNKYGADGAVGAAAFFDPTKPAYNTDDSYPANALQAGKYNGFWNWTKSDGSVMSDGPDPNPLSQIYDYTNKGKTKRFIGNAQFDYKMHFLPELRANLNLGLDVAEGSGNTRNAIGSYQAEADKYLPGTGTNSNWKNFRRNELLDFYLDYAKDFKSISSRLDVMAGYSWQHFFASDLSLTQSNLTATELGVTDVDTYYLGDDNYFHKQGEYKKPYENYLISFFGRLNYTFMDRYLLTATLRRDGSSKFSKDNRWGTFPSVALAWTIKNESFLKDVDFLDNLRLRLGYGVTGQQAISGNYDYIPSYVISSNPESTYLGSYLIKPDGYNPNLKWEETTTYNIAVDYAFLNSRINGSIEFYIKKTKDLLNTVSSPAGTNFTNLITGNVGSMKNKGVEITINTVPVETKDWHWDLNYNVTWNTSKITKLTAAYNPDYPGINAGRQGPGTGTYYEKHNVGYTPNTFYLYKQIYDENGKPIQNAVVDLNGDGQITPDGDRYMTGKSPMAKWYMGLSSLVRYKDFDFGFNLRANIGNYMYNALAASNASIHGFWDQGYVSNLTDVSLATGFNRLPEQACQFSDYFLENASFLKCDNITLGYNFKNLFNTKLSGRISFSVQNVFTITDYSGLDPEVNGDGGDGIDYTMWPRPRTYTLGLNLNF